MLASPAAVLAQSAPAATSPAVTSDPIADQAAPTPVDAPAQTGGDIVVTGTRIQSTGVNQPTPITVVGQDLIRQNAAPQLAAALNTLPQFRSTSTPTTQFVGGGGNIVGANLLDLRGLGPTRTLVLVDGIRFPPTSSNETFNTDLIPTSLVSRVDVVTGGASAAYGSDAVAGVVNIVLDHKIEGIRGSAQMGITDVGDGEDQTYSVAAGHGFADGRIHVVFGADYERRQAVGNCYTRSWCAQEYGVVSNATPGANGLPALVIAPNVRASQITPAGLVVSSRLIAAYGGQEVSPDGLSLQPFSFGQLYAPNNNQMIGGSRQGINAFSTAFNLQAPTKRFATYFHGEGDVTDSIQAFVDASFGGVVTNGNYAQLRAGNQNAAGTAPSGPLNTSAIALSINNPFLPAQLRTEMQSLGLTTVNIGKAGDAFPLPASHVRTSTYRVATGLKGKLGSFKWDAAYFNGATNLAQQETNDINQANFTRAVQALPGTGANAGTVVCAANAVTVTAPGCAPLNLFGVNTASPAALAYAFGTATSNLNVHMNDATFNVQGQPFSLWAGPISIATGVEYRRESLRADVDALSAAGAFVQNMAALQGNSRVFEAYGETEIPLLKDSPVGTELSLNGAFRWTQYKLSSVQAPLGGTRVGSAASTLNATTWKAGLVYRPIDWVRVRGTVSRDFRAPNLSELYSLPNVQNAAVLDPVSRTQTQVPTQAGGNPNLRPEIGNTLTAGVTIQPPALRNFQLSVDYYRIKVRDYIAAIGAQTLVNECAAGAQDACAFVFRDATGTLTLVQNTSANANSLSEEGIDIEAGYRHAIGARGNLNLRLLTTIYTKLTYVNAGQPISGKCQNGFVTQQAYPSQPCYSMNAFVNYSHGPIGLGVQVNYIPQGKFGANLVGPQDPGYNPTLSNSVNNNRVPAIAYVTLNTSYQIIKDGRHSFEIYGVIKNLFNQDPPNAPANNIGTNATLYDVVGRVFRIGARFAY